MSAVRGPRAGRRVGLVRAAAVAALRAEFGAVWLPSGRGFFFIVLFPGFPPGAPLRAAGLRGRIGPGRGAAASAPGRAGGGASPGWRPASFGSELHRAAAARFRRRRQRAAPAGQRLAACVGGAGRPGTWRCGDAASAPCGARNRSATRGGGSAALELREAAGGRGGPTEGESLPHPARGALSAGVCTG